MPDPLTGYLRVKTVCLFLHRGRLLALEAFDPTKQQAFRVPVGGRVEFGERTIDAIEREIVEELSTGVTDLRLLGVLENLFTFDGGQGHEIVFVYDGRFTDPSMYEKPEVAGVENGRPFAAHWIDPLDTGDVPLYPDGLIELLSSPLLP